VRRSVFSVLTAAFVALSAVADEPVAKPVLVSIDTTLKTDGEHICQLAFDGDNSTYFASQKNPDREDRFTIVLGKPVAAKRIRVDSGQPGNLEGALESGLLEVSADGKTFDALAKFESGSTDATLDGRMIRAIRIRPTHDMSHPLVIREFTIESDPPVAVFKYPVEFVVSVEDAPEMKEWAEKAARICAENYAMINEELKSDGFKPPHLIRMTLKNDYRGVAATGRSGITGSVKYFKDHPDDIGAMVHETVHVVQRYRTRNNPGWLVEGIADYVRFYKYEPGKLRPLNPDRAKYDGSYKVTAQFLAYLSDKYDKEIVRRLNKIMRDGEYKAEIWQTLTKKSLQELGDEWKESLRK
jgi:Peptidase of plants and bacteria/F5/8 type C domain